jgi:hypothetical protein
VVEPRHSIADLLRLLDSVRRLAFDRSLDDVDRAARRRVVSVVVRGRVVGEEVCVVMSKVTVRWNVNTARDLGEQGRTWNGVDVAHENVGERDETVSLYRGDALIGTFNRFDASVLLVDDE